MMKMNRDETRGRGQRRQPGLVSSGRLASPGVGEAGAAAKGRDGAGLAGWARARRLLPCAGAADAAAKGRDSAGLAGRTGERCASPRVGATCAAPRGCTTLTAGAVATSAGCGSSEAAEWSVDDRDGGAVRDKHSWEDEKAV